MKLGSKDVAYSSLELDDPSSPSQQPIAMRRNMASNTSTSSLQSTVSISSSASSATVMDSMEPPRSSFFASNIREAPAGLEGLVRQLAVEVKGALLATG